MLVHCTERILPGGQHCTETAPGARQITKLKVVNNNIIFLSKSCSLKS